MYYQLLRHAVRSGTDIGCAICGRPAQHRLLVSPAVLLRSPMPPVAIEPERRGLCRECGRGRHALSFVSDEEIERLRDTQRVDLLDAY